MFFALGPVEQKLLTKERMNIYAAIETQHIIPHKTLHHVFIKRRPPQKKKKKGFSLSLTCGFQNVASFLRPRPKKRKVQSSDSSSGLVGLCRDGSDVMRGGSCAERVGGGPD